MFDLVTAHDFYAMLVEDFDDFMAEPHSAREAVHCFITAHHLLDWVWHDPRRLPQAHPAAAGRLPVFSTGYDSQADSFFAAPLS